ncbi:MAG TPA: class I mannose-6-phosphate isomerase [Candidatus Alistipes faecavium]|uniref:type I phosphomannose isomerase catalytic subunit n=1 Tax=uncultured Alistipes sp. TaxID=538949 RepID=UPI001FA38FC4|nr:type I phosphomannose isomerase catalytic subunit [uncultured Alistipes sp.]HJA96686.1 class I mannose-6-phosphate isomerase [Candidatus Alistipes faecavium]
MYKFKPILKSLIWGGEKIAPYKQIETDQHNIGESWELSGVKDNESVVAEGPEAGTPLPELIARHGSALLGRENFERFGTEFPLLIKFIDARQDLSIQVHPNDELAWERHKSKGKTEMWYVVAADEGAHLRSGFAKEVTPEEYEASVADNTITDILTDYKIQPGDVFFLPAGRVHAIGAGSFIAEIQQTSNITYRIYDYGRVGADGKPRELHTELAKGAIDYTVLPDYRTHYRPEYDKRVELVSCPYFTTSLYDLTRQQGVDLSRLNSFVVVICLEGSGTLTSDAGSSVSIHQGETVLVPASTWSMGMIPDGRMKVLTSWIE